MIVVSPMDPGTLTCGVHARGWLPHGLARIAWWRPKTGQWT